MFRRFLTKRVIAAVLTLALGAAGVAMPETLLLPVAEWIVEAVADGAGE